VISTPAVQNLLGGDATTARARRPDIVADAAHVILCRPSRDTTGQFFVDDDLLYSVGVTDLDRYASVPESDLLPDLFV
jgi:citronellol/citronellal dehydrogenase